jgi:DASS family divalent anion:Na+ symporter
VLSGFANQTVWQIFAAFLFFRAIVSTELGTSVAYLLIRRFGSSSLRLGYSAVALVALPAPSGHSLRAQGFERTDASALDDAPATITHRIRETVDN